MVTAAVFSEPEIAARMKEASEITAEHGDSMTGAVMLILSFYFAAPHLDKVVGPAMERFANGGKTK